MLLDNETLKMDVLSKQQQAETVDLRAQLVVRKEVRTVVHFETTTTIYCQFSSEPVHL